MAIDKSTSGGTSSHKALVAKLTTSSDCFYKPQLFSRFKKLKTPPFIKLCCCETKGLHTFLAVLDQSNSPAAFFFWSCCNNCNKKKCRLLKHAAPFSKRTAFPAVKWTRCSTWAMSKEVSVSGSFFFFSLSPHFVPRYCILLTWPK